MQFYRKIGKQSLDFIISHKQKLLVLKVYALYILLIGILYAGDSFIDVYRGKSNAYSMAQDFVSQKLVAPSTAKFPLRSDDNVLIEYLGKKRYRISGYLVSKNTFGNEQKSDYVCTVKYLEPGKWVCETIKFE